MREAMEGELVWEQLSAQLNLNPLKVIYEDLCSRPREELAKVLTHLRLPDSQIAPQTVKLSRDSNKDAKRKFLQEIGVECPPAA